MASTISAGTTTTTALVYSADTSGVLQLQTNGGTTAVTLDTSQNATFAGKVASASSLQLATNGTTIAITVDTSQNVLLGTTSGGGYRFEVHKASATPQYINRTTSTGGLLDFAYNGSTVGSVSTNGTTTTYNTSSDYRLKESIAPMTGALAKVSLLKPCTYKWKSDGTDGQGFIAHELAEVVAGCVTGEKDAVDANGKPVYQGIDTSFLVATLTAAIQEQQAMITTLQTQVTALKG